MYAKANVFAEKSGKISSPGNDGNITPTYLLENASKDDNRMEGKTNFL